MPEGRFAIPLLHIYNLKWKKIREPNPIYFSYTVLEIALRTSRTLQYKVQIILSWRVFCGISEFAKNPAGVQNTTGSKLWEKNVDVKFFLNMLEKGKNDILKLVFVVLPKSKQTKQTFGNYYC